MISAKAAEGGRLPKEESLESMPLDSMCSCERPVW